MKNKSPDQSSEKIIRDIFEENLIERNVDPENPDQFKNPVVPPKDPEAEITRLDLIGDDLDVPGVELDDETEEIGSEDEENNYYSLGGDYHSDLDEN